MKNKKKIKFYCIGDSHVAVFSGINGIIPVWPKKAPSVYPSFVPYRLGPVLAYNLCKEKTTTRGREKLFKLLNKEIPKGSNVIFVFGEIDCRAHLIKQAEKQKRDIKEIVKECVKRYFSVLLEVKKIGYKVSVFGVFPSSLRTNQNPNYPFYGTHRERNTVSRLFNNYLSKLAKKNRILMFDIFNKLVDKDKLTKLEYYQKDKVHLSLLAMPIIVNEIEQKTGYNLDLFDFNLFNKLIFKIRLSILRLNRLLIILRYKVKRGCKLINSLILLFFKLIYACLNLLALAIKKVLFFLKVFIIFLRQNECQLLKDCLLLYKLKRQQPPASDRYIEYPWMIENIDIKKGKILDVGSTACLMLRDLLPKSIEVHGINLREQKVDNKKVKFKKGDIRKAGYKDNYFDCITCISTLEHIGVKGRYKSDDDSRGDIRAMKEMRRILKKDGPLLVTVPYGKKDVLPINRLYNKKRIKKLFKGFKIEEQAFRKFSKKWRVWLKVSEKEASATDMIKDKWYAICLIRARKI